MGVGELMDDLGHKMTPVERKAWLEDDLRVSPLHGCVSKRADGKTETINYIHVLARYKLTLEQYEALCRAEADAGGDTPPVP